jgi:hypothetical protein
LRSDQLRNLKCSVTAGGDDNHLTSVVDLHAIGLAGAKISYSCLTCRWSIEGTAHVHVSRHSFLTPSLPLRTFPFLARATRRLLTSAASALSMVAAPGSIAESSTASDEQWEESQGKSSSHRPTTPAPHGEPDAPSMRPRLSGDRPLSGRRRRSWRRAVRPISFHSMQATRRFWSAAATGSAGDPSPGDGAMRAEARDDECTDCSGGVAS